jgi:hypothetical protein
MERTTELYPPKFSVGDEVIWAYVEAHDYGVVVECRVRVDDSNRP